MKKIIGILGISLVVALSFFNISSVVDANQNVDLASIIQNASADDEDGGWGYNDKFESDYTEHEPVNTYENGRWKSCVKIYIHHVVECYGSGNLDCTPADQELPMPGETEVKCL